MADKMNSGTFGLSSSVTRLPITRWLARIPRGWLVALFTVSLVARLAYAIVISDPMSGPDAPTYRDSAEFIALHGYFVDGIPGIPYWPAGYSVLLSPIAAVFGDSWMKVTQVVQVLLLSLAIVAVRQAVVRWAGAAVANLAFIILLFLPSLTASAPLFMYEVPVGSFIALATWALTLVLLPDSSKRPRTMLLLVAAGLILGFTTAMQPKTVLLIGVSLFLLWGIVPWKERAAFIASAALPVLPFVLRNVIVHGQWGLTWELGVTMSQGNGGRTLVCDGGTNIFDRDRILVLCNLKTNLSDPIGAVGASWQQFLNFLWPFTGPQSPGSTWYHGFNLRRLLPSSLTSSPPFLVLDSLAGPVTVVVLSILFLIGLYGARRLNQRVTILFAAPMVTFLFTSLVVRGDGRFRIPTTPTSVPFTVIAILVIVASAFRAWIYLRAARRREAVSP